MKKRQYDKPSMKVVVLQHRSMLLAGSLDRPSNYPGGGNPFSF